MVSGDLIPRRAEEEAHQNREQTLRLVEQTVKNFLEIGRLLKECYEKHYWAVLGYKSFREYIGYLNLPVVNSYSWATRLMAIYELSTHRLAPPREELIKIGVSKLARLLPAAKKGEVTTALWEKAKAMTYKELDFELGGKVSVSRPYMERVSPHDIHSDIQKKIEEIGKILGKYAKREYRAKVYRYDVVWKDARWLQRMSHVFEIQVGGDVDSALLKLQDAYSTRGHPHLFLVIATQQDRNRAEQLLYAGGMNEIASATLLISPEEINDIHKSVARNREVFRKLLGK